MADHGGALDALFSKHLYIIMAMEGDPSYKEVYASANGASNANALCAFINREKAVEKAKEYTSDGRGVVLVRFDLEMKVGNAKAFHNGDFDSALA